MGEPRVRAFRRMIRRIERLLTFDLKDTCFCSGVTLAQCHTLLELEGIGRATLCELAGRMELDSSTLSRNVDGLVRAGQIRRTSHPEDRRALALTLTARGRRTCARINAVNDRLFGRVLAALPAGKADGIITALEEFARALAAATNRPEPAGEAPLSSGAGAAMEGAARRRRPLRSASGRRDR